MLTIDLSQKSQQRNTLFFCITMCQYQTPPTSRLLQTTPSSPQKSPRDSIRWRNSSSNYKVVHFHEDRTYIEPSYSLNAQQKQRLWWSKEELQNRLENQQAGRETNNYSFLFIMFFLFNLMIMVLASCCI
jgi:hypothetical protein